MALLDMYRDFLRKKLLNEFEASPSEFSKKPLSVGVVGAGISGLYSALLLQHYVPNVKVKIFEANGRVGGRIFTYKFSDEPYQYFEAGAMRIPCSSSQEPVFKLIDYLNKSEPDDPLKLIEFVTDYPAGNRVYINGTKMKDGRIMTAEYANTHCSELGFSQDAHIKDGDGAWILLNEALQPLFLDLTTDFEKAMKKYGNVSLHQYLIDAGWSSQRICYFETVGVMSSNTCHTGLLDQVISFASIFGKDVSFKTVEGGMSLLPEKCANLVQKQGGEICLNTKVRSLSYSKDNTTIRLGYNGSQSTTAMEHEDFDAVILATPSPCIRQLQKPTWSSETEYALRSIRHLPLLKILLRFNSRFWERKDLQHEPSLGGTSRTDLPITEIVYPSHGLGDNGKGILCMYTYLSEAMFLPSLPDIEKVQLLLRDLQTLYPEVNIAEEYAGGTDPSSSDYIKEMFVMNWTNEWCMGSTGTHFPGQFKHVYPLLAQNQGNVYFAGDHLSVNPLFIAGALDSTRFAVQQLVKRQVSKDTTINFL